VRYNKTSEAVSCLLGRGAAPEAADDEGDTPLHAAAQQGFLDAIVTLVETGADVDAVNRFVSWPAKPFGAVG
jgi:ankyrin repeat protein